MALCFFVGCKNNPNNHDPKGVVWITNAQAMLFRVGYNQTDSFLEVYNDPKSKQLLGAFFWENLQRLKGIKKFNSETKL